MWKQQSLMSFAARDGKPRSSFAIPLQASFPRTQKLPRPPIPIAGLARMTVVAPLASLVVGVLVVRVATVAMAK